jgi:hypothetical protein
MGIVGRAARVPCPVTPRQKLESPPAVLNNAVIAHRRAGLVDVVYEYLGAWLWCPYAVQ